jgi:hypothetical protein
MGPNIQLVGNLWGYIIYWFFGDFIDLITYTPHVNTGMREYFGANIGSPILAVWLLVGTFVDLRLLALVAIFILVTTPGRLWVTFQLRLLRALDRLPLPFIG